MSKCFSNQHKAINDLNTTFTDGERPSQPLGDRPGTDNFCNSKFCSRFGRSDRGLAMHFNSAIEALTYLRDQTDMIENRSNRKELRHSFNLLNRGDEDTILKIFSYPASFSELPALLRSYRFSRVPKCYGELSLKVSSSHILLWSIFSSVYGTVTGTLNCLNLHCSSNS